MKLAPYMSLIGVSGGGTPPSLVWNALPFGAGFGNLGSGYASCAYAAANGFCYLRGLAITTTATGNTPIASGLPIPSNGQQTVFATQAQAGIIRLDLSSTGILYYSSVFSGTFGVNHWFILENLRWGI